jgi:LmbE family N-acetylglucosaminyl deacetylase
VSVGPEEDEPGRESGTIAMFWAHYDDDLVFANPTLLHALERGRHARSFFFTASDAGHGMTDYTAGREHGIRAAYDAMRGADGPWSDESVTLRSGLTVTVTRPVDDDRISLTFLRLPDGGLRGGGYAKTGWESLAKLHSGELSSIRTLDTGQEVTLDQLTRTIAELVHDHRPASVISLHPGFADEPGDDHPDHQTVGRLVAAAVDAGLVDADLVRYAIGYPGARHPANIDPAPLRRKLEVFAAYGAHDPVVTRADVEEYLSVRGFGEWLQREYLLPHRDVERVPV